MSIVNTIEEKLSAELNPLNLDVINESHLHASHASSPGTGESHFRVVVVSDKFIGVSRVNRQRMVYDVLKDELAGPVHALALVTKTPDEVA